MVFTRFSTEDHQLLRIKFIEKVIIRYCRISI